MTINYNSKCNSCANKTVSDSCQKIGQQVHINGGIRGDTDHIFYQCNLCGSVLVEIQDRGGLGGHGTFYHLLTEKLF